MEETPSKYKLYTVDELIKMAFQEECKVNFKIIEVILLLLAKKLNVLYRNVNVGTNISPPEIKMLIDVITVTAQKHSTRKNFDEHGTEKGHSEIDEQEDENDRVDANDQASQKGRSDAVDKGVRGSNKGEQAQIRSSDKDEQGTKKLRQTPVENEPKHGKKGIVKKYGKKGILKRQKEDFSKENIYLVYTVHSPKRTLWTRKNFEMTEIFRAEVDNDANASMPATSSGHRTSGTSSQASLQSLVTKDMYDTLVAKITTLRVKFAEYRPRVYTYEETMQYLAQHMHKIEDVNKRTLYLAKLLTKQRIADRDEDGIKVYPEYLSRKTFLGILKEFKVRQWKEIFVTFSKWKQNFLKTPLFEVIKILEERSSRFKEQIDIVTEQSQKELEILETTHDDYHRKLTLMFSDLADETIQLRDDLDDVVLAMDDAMTQIGKNEEAYNHVQEGIQNLRADNREFYDGQKEFSKEMRKFPIDKLQDVTTRALNVENNKIDRDDAIRILNTKLSLEVYNTIVQFSHSVAVKKNLWKILNDLIKAIEAKEYAWQHTIDDVWSRADLACDDTQLQTVKDDIWSKLSMLRQRLEYMQNVLGPPKRVQVELSRTIDKIQCISCKTDSEDGQPVKSVSLQLKPKAKFTTEKEKVEKDIQTLKSLPKKSKKSGISVPNDKNPKGEKLLTITTIKLTAPGQKEVASHKTMKTKWVPCIPCNVPLGNQKERDRSLKIIPYTVTMEKSEKIMT